MREMGRIVADQKETGIEETWSLYFDRLTDTLEKGASYTDHINVLQHCFGYISKELNPDEKGFFLDLLEAFRDDRVPLSTCKEVLRGYIIRFKVEYLTDQVYFRPYPVELAPGYDPKRDRELWK
jgi:uncharacterized protein YbgA (DUF1722 family)